MCDLCDSATQKKEKERLLEQAATMRRFATSLEQLAVGYILPHSDSACRMKDPAKTIVKFLVDEWI